MRYVCFSIGLFNFHIEYEDGLTDEEAIRNFFDTHYFSNLNAEDAVVLESGVVE